MRWVYWLGWMSFGAAFRTLFGLKIIGSENLISDGPVLVASNHQSFLDPPLIIPFFLVTLLTFVLPVFPHLARH
jgi:1-acyl-sn-glycerol-3-phosphate acyltransferase